MRRTARQQASATLATEVRAELAHILSSRTLRLSERHKKFLTFIVEETIAGRADRIKAYTVATSAFGRGENFDPQQDSIVRIEAGRLRRELERHYLTEGVGAPLRIEIPKGSYVPQFMTAKGADRTDAPSVPAQIPRRGPKLLVAPFDRDSESDQFVGFETAFTRQVIMGLTRFSTIMVYGPETAWSQGSHAHLPELSRMLDVDYVLTGRVALTTNSLVVDLLLQDLLQGRFVWAERFERALAPGDLRDLRDEVASQIVQTLAQPYGVFHRRALDNEGEPPRDLGSYLSVLEYNEFLRTYDVDSLERIREGLEKAIQKDPSFAEAFACLSMLETNAERTAAQPVEGNGDRLRRALGHARHAIFLAPNSSRAHHALAMALWFSGDIADSLAAYRHALSLNPFDTEIMAELALRYAMRMDWERAMPLVEDSFRRNPCQPQFYNMVPFLYHLAAGQPEEALKYARRSNNTKVPYTKMAIAAAAAASGQVEEARAAAADVEQQVPEYGKMFLTDAASRHLHPDLAEIWGAALHKAGLPGAFNFRDVPLEATARIA
jgi:TolB-like protein